MKNIFGIDITDRNKPISVAKKFLERGIDDEIKREFDRSNAEFEEIMRQGEMPAVLDLVRKIVTFVFYCALLVAVITRFRWLNITIGGVIAASFIIGRLIKWYGDRRNRSVYYDKKYLDYIDKRIALNKRILEENHIPEDAAEIDVLLELFEVKKGKVKHKDFGIVYCRNIPLKMFEENQYLCITDTIAVYRIPYTSIRGVSFTKWKVNFHEWNKLVSYKSKRFKAAKLVLNGMGIFNVKGLKVEIEYENEQYYLMVPLYEKDTITELAHLRSYFLLETEKYA